MSPDQDVKIGLEQNSILASRNRQRGSVQLTRVLTFAAVSTLDLKFELEFLTLAFGMDNDPRRHPRTSHLRKLRILEGCSWHAGTNYAVTEMSMEEQSRMGRSLEAKQASTCLLHGKRHDF